MLQRETFDIRHDAKAIIDCVIAVNMNNLTQVQAITRDKVGNCTL